MSEMPHPNDPVGGTLYVVSTPIGNLEDITFRAVRVLRGAAVIAAEDTRTSRVLLNHYDIGTPCVSLFSGNEKKRIPELLARLASGDAVAVISDAGTPGVSDPAALLISACVDAGMPVVAVPGASALLAALVTSGMRIDRFHFEGFLPIKKRRQTRIRGLAAEERTIVLYESVHRLLRTLRELGDALGEDRRICVCRELTKKFEESRRGTIAEVRAHFESHAPRGEFVLVIGGRAAVRREDPELPETGSGTADEDDA